MPWFILSVTAERQSDQRGDVEVQVTGGGGERVTKCGLQGACRRVPAMCIFRAAAVYTRELWTSVQCAPISQGSQSAVLISSRDITVYNCRLFMPAPHVSTRR